MSRPRSAPIRSGLRDAPDASFGWLGGTALGGWMMAQHGFAGFGPLAAGVAALGGTLALAGRRR
jgi:hypothetical protein